MLIAQITEQIGERFDSPGSDSNGQLPVLNTDQVCVCVCVRACVCVLVGLDHLSVLFVFVYFFSFSFSLCIWGRVCLSVYICLSVCLSVRLGTTCV